MKYPDKGASQADFEIYYSQLSYWEANNLLEDLEGLIQTVKSNTYEHEGLSLKINALKSVIRAYDEL